MSHSLVDDVRTLVARLIMPPGRDAAPPAEPAEAPQGKGYGAYWDQYVTHQFPTVKHGAGAAYEWPGDEWGDRALWERIFDSLFVQHLPADARTFVEIGAGSGKYTLFVLEHFPQAKVRCFDVSSAFLDSLRARCAEQIRAGRIEPIVMNDDPRFMYSRLERDGLLGQVDCLYSIDAMVHVDLQYLMAYLLTAQAALRIGGKLVLSLADATSDGGFAKLVGDIRPYFPLQGQISSKFEWLSPDLARSILGRLGFVVDGTYDLNGRDLCLVATLKERPAISW